MPLVSVGHPFAAWVKLVSPDEWLASLAAARGKLIPAGQVPYSTRIGNGSEPIMDLEGIEAGCKQTWSECRPSDP